MSSNRAVRALLCALACAAGLAGVAACSHDEEAPRTPERRDELDEECHATMTCSDLPNELEEPGWGGVRDYVGDPRGGTDAACEFVLPYSPPRVPAHVEARVWATRGKLFPSGPGVMKLVECSWWTHVQRLYEPTARVNANFALYRSSAPRQDTIVLAFTGDALLEEKARAVASYEAPTAGGTAAVTVSVTPYDAYDPFNPPEVHRGLSVGSSFPWGAYRATIVRIVEPSASVVGWAEVELTRGPP